MTNRLLCADTHAICRQAFKLLSESALPLCAARDVSEEKTVSKVWPECVVLFGTTVVLSEIPTVTVKGILGEPHAQLM